MIRRAPRPDHGFLIIRNDVIRDRRVSYRARGLLAAMLSYPDDWQFNRDWLAGQSDSDGVTAVRTALKELERVGYLQRQRVHLPGGRFGWEHVLYDTPQTVIVAGGATGGFPADGSATDGGPADENPPSKEEPSRTTVDEDVTDQSCPDDVRFAHIVGANEKQDRSLTDDPHDDEQITAQDINNWRQQDRALFAEIVGPKLTSRGQPWTKGQFTAGQFYVAFRAKEKGIRWPGRFLESIRDTGDEYAVDDWLTTQGLERAA